MLKPVYTNRFEKDIRLVVRRNLDMEKLKAVIQEIINQEKLDDVYKKLFLKEREAILIYSDNI